MQAKDKCDHKIKIRAPKGLRDAKPCVAQRGGAEQWLGQFPQIALHDAGEHVRVARMRSARRRPARLARVGLAALLLLQIGLAHALIKLLSKTPDAGFAAGEAEEALQDAKNTEHRTCTVQYRYSSYRVQSYASNN